MKKTFVLWAVISCSTSLWAADGKALCKDRFTSLEKAVKDNFSNEKAWKDYRACVTELKRWHDGQLLADAALKKNAENPEAYLMRGIAELHTKNFTKASAFFKFNPNFLF